MKSIAKVVACIVVLTGFNATAEQPIGIFEDGSPWEVDPYGQARPFTSLLGPSIDAEVLGKVVRTRVSQAIALTIEDMLEVKGVGATIYRDLSRRGTAWRKCRKLPFGSIWSSGSVRRK